MDFSFKFQNGVVSDESSDSENSDSEDEEGECCRKAEMLPSRASDRSSSHSDVV